MLHPVNITAPLKELDPQTRATSPMQWRVGESRARVRSHTMVLKVFLRILAEVLGFLEVQLGSIRVEGKQEGMEVVILDKGTIGIRMEMEMRVVRMRLGVLEVRLGTGDKEIVGMP